MPFADLTLSIRLEAAEASASALLAQARSRVQPESGACWIQEAGATAIFDGPHSPCTQTFGLGLSGELAPATLDRIETFFLDRQAPVLHEVSPFAGPAALALLCRRGYLPEEISNILYRPIADPGPPPPPNLTVRIPPAVELPLWNNINARGWAADHPELEAFLRDFGAVSSAREQTICFLGELDGVPSATAALCLHQGVALFAGAATLSELRNRGLQRALFHARMRYALAQGSDLAMMVALPGSSSQRNAERSGFSVAYTRTKWRLAEPRNG
ncbi:MAG: hypothetical protein WCE75_04675 [Terracidiphilus sp.]